MIADVLLAMRGASISMMDIGLAATNSGTPTSSARCACVIAENWTGTERTGNWGQYTQIPNPSADRSAPPFLDGRFEAAAGSGFQLSHEGSSPKGRPRRVGERNRSPNPSSSARDAGHTEGVQGFKMYLSVPSPVSPVSRPPSPSRVRPLPVTSPRSLWFGPIPGMGRRLGTLEPAPSWLWSVHDDNRRPAAPELSF